MPSSGIPIPELPRKKWSREEVCVLEWALLLTPCFSPRADLRIGNVAGQRLFFLFKQ